MKNLNPDDSYLDNIVKQINQRIKGYKPIIRPRKPGPKPKQCSNKDNTAISGVESENTETRRKKPGPKPGYKPGALNINGTERKKPGPKPGSKKGLYNDQFEIRKILFVLLMPCICKENQ